MNLEKQSTNLQMTLREVNRVGEGQKNVPKLRFKGYEDAWEQRKLGEVSQIVGGGTPSTGIPEYWDGDIDWYSPVEIGEEIFVSCSQRKITQLGLEKSSAKILPEGTVLFTSRAGIGNTAILEKEGCTNQGFQSIVPKDNELDSYFIFSCSHLLKKYGETKGAGSTFVEISGKQMSLMPLNIPEIKEQKSVGNFFRKLDSIITLHQRKYDALKSMKKILLSKMFPKNGEDVPEIRFKEFTDAWEQRKLGDIAESTYGGGTPKTTVEEFWNGGIPWIQSSDIQEDQVFNVQVRKTITEKGLANSAAKLIPKNSVAIVTRVGVGKLGLIPFDFTTSQDFLSLSNLNIDSNFAVYLLFKRLQFESKMAQGTSIKGITKEELLSKEVKIAHIDMEQKSIGYFFQNLDDIITLHQRKLEELKNMKKTLLQQMFV